MGDEDVERFLWEVETHLADLPGDRRIIALRQVERDLDEVAHDIATKDDRSSPTWYDYVQATAVLGPPAQLAATILGRPLDPGRVPRRAYVLAAIAGLTLVGVVIAMLLSPLHFTDVGAWSGTETERTETLGLDFTVAADAERVGFHFSFFPNPGSDGDIPPGTAHLIILDGDSVVVFEADATVANALQTTRFFEGAPGTWNVFIDFNRYTGPWSLTAFEAR